MLNLFLIVFIDLIGFGIVIPLLPFYGEVYGASPFWVAVLLLSYSLAQFVAAPFWGRMSDRIGRRPVLLMTLAGLAVSYIATAFAPTLIALFAARLFGGFMAGNIATAFAYVADITTKETRAKGMGAVGAAFGLGFILGPAIGGILAGSDPLNPNVQLPALVAAGFTGLAFLYAVVRLPESLKPEIRERIKNKPRQTRLAAFKEAMAKPDVGRLIGISFLATFVFAGMETTFAMWSKREFGWGPEQNGYLFAGVGLVSALIQGGLIGRLVKRFGEDALIIQGAAALALGIALIPFVVDVWTLAAAMTVVAYGFAVINPSLNSRISQAVGEDEQGGIFGVTRSATTLARVVGPAFAGLLFEFLGRDWPYYAGAVIMVGVVIFALLGRRAIKQA